MRFYYALFPVVAADNLTPKHKVIIDVVKNHNLAQKADEHNHKHQRAGEVSHLASIAANWVLW